MLKLKGIIKMPLKFMAKIEVHPFLTLIEVIGLFNEINNDESIVEVKFPFMGKDPSKVPNLFVDHFDEQTLHWKKEATAIEIHIRYGGRPKNTTKKGETKPPTNVVQECSIQLERMIMNSSKDFDLRAEGQQQSVR